MVRGSRGHLPPFSVLPLIGSKQTGISSCRGGEKEGLEAKTIKKQAGTVTPYLSRS